MKKLLLILLCLPMIGFGQKTYVPNNNFENYLEGNGMGDGIFGNDSVTTANINTVTHLDIQGVSVANSLTGIEDFTSLTNFNCADNQITSLDLSNNTALQSLNCNNNLLISLNVSQNTALTYLTCNDNQLSSLNTSSNTLLDYLSVTRNQLSSLNVDNNINLTELWCGENQLTTLDVSQNTVLDYLMCNYNQITSLDVSQNTALTNFNASDNQITSLDVSNNTALYRLELRGNPISTFNLNNHTNLNWLNIMFTQISSLDVSNCTNLTALFCMDNNQLSTLDVRNGNNTNFNYVGIRDNPNLYCISVDDVTWANSQWISYLDPWCSFSSNCPPPSKIQEHTTNKELLKVTDLLGRETKQTNQPLFYIYDDGTVEKRINIK